MITLRKTGYRPRSWPADISLGLFDGLDNALWCYAFASVIFAGAMASFLPLLVGILLFGWALLAIWTALTSQKNLHVVSLDEQAVVILASIAGLMVAEMGPGAVGPRGLSTMLVIMALSSLAVAGFFWLIGHYRLTRLLELMPYPVICGFMAGIGWLLLEAGVDIAVDTSVAGVGEALQDPMNVSKLLLYLSAAIFLLVASLRWRVAWALPGASVLLAVIFFVIAGIHGLGREELVQHGWLFDIQSGSALDMLGQFSFAMVDTDFVLSMLPQILTIAFLALLTQSMSLSALMAADGEDLDTSSEISDMGKGNVLCALIGSPPGSTDVVASSVYREFGASSRWTSLITAGVCLVMALVGSLIMPWVPKLLVGATVFLFAWQLFHEWMYQNVRGFQPIDFTIVLIILATVIFVGFMPGILVGILLALLLFVLRYSMISAIQGHYSLADYRSSVERSQADNELLDTHGGGGLIYTLRGFLFFGTANAILDTIRDTDRVRSGRYRVILLDLKRVTGMDISALNTFAQIRTTCELAGVRVVYSGVTPETRDSLLMLDAVSFEHGQPLVFDDADYAVEYMEDMLLERYASESDGATISELLADIFEEREKVDLLVSHMERVEVAAGEMLFEQGDPDSGLFMLERGSMTALIRLEADGLKRVKKFRPGVLIGELSAYTPERMRTATVVADEDSVLYHLSAESLARLDAENLKLAASIHELVARTLGGRIGYMNRRLFLELG